MIVDDGHGKSLVAVNVQRWKPKDPSMSGVFKHAHTLVDGTRVNTSKDTPTHGGKGTVEWTADTFRKDSLRVVVSAANAPAYLLPATRSEPALTIE